MDIKLVNSEIIIFKNPENNKLNNFGVNFDIKEEFSTIDQNNTKLIIHYTIPLYHNKTIKFGVIIATYEFHIPETFEFINLNENTRQKTLLFYLKMNHNNIYSLIKTSLEEEGLKIIEKNRSIIH